MRPGSEWRIGTLAIVLVVTGVLLVWLASEGGWLGLSAGSMSDLPMLPMAVALVVLCVLWLWRRRARWH